MLNSYITEYRNSLVNVAFRITDDKAAAEDVVQDVCLSIFKTSEQFRGAASPKTYLYRIVINRSIDYVRRIKRTKNIFDFLSHEQNSDESRPDFIEMKDLAKRLLSSIPHEFRVPLMLAEIDQLTYEEIGDVLNVSLNTVRTRIFRGRERMRTEYRKLGIES